jgi:hypothetical protein
MTNFKNVVWFEVSDLRLVANIWVHWVTWVYWVIELLSDATMTPI